MKLGFLGLGKMGKRMAWKLLEGGHDVVVWNRSAGVVEEFVDQYEKLPAEKKKNFGILSVAATIEEYKSLLSKTRVFWSMVPAGEATDSLLDEISSIVENDDIVIDGGNSFYKDTEERYNKFKKMKVRFLGIGVSGGITAPINGYPLMAGGEESAYEYVIPLLKSLSFPNGGYDYFGTGGAGHYVKMVHNGIEYPFMQAIGEGFGVLENSSYKFDLLKIAKLYTKGTLISGYMMDRTVEALQQDSHLDSIQGTIGSASGETTWTIDEAHKHNLPIESIEQSRDFRVRSEKEPYVQNSFAAKMVGALRIVFGGHPVKRK